MAEIARTADDAGFYSIWVMDHLFQLGTRYGIIHGPVEDPMIEGYSTISYLAGLTKQIRLGLLVTCCFYRNPGLLVKTVSTIDVLSRGRTYFGIGAGWNERESRGLGYSFPSLRERFERLEETLQIAKHMWSGDTTPFSGKQYNLAEPINSPQPLSKPHPPILIGGGGEKKTLRFVARYGDACNLVMGTTLDAGVLRQSREEGFNELRHKLQVLRKHCRDLGRPYDDIEKTVATYIKLAPDAMSTNEVVELCHELDGLGFDHVIFNMPNVHEIEPIQTIGDEIIPQVRRL
jgi:F420-dependent oxidoreductase-like protein